MILVIYTMYCHLDRWDHWKSNLLKAIHTLKKFSLNNMDEIRHKHIIYIFTKNIVMLSWETSTIPSGVLFKSQSELQISWTKLFLNYFSLEFCFCSFFKISVVQKQKNPDLELKMYLTQSLYGHRWPDCACSLG